MSGPTLASLNSRLDAILWNPAATRAALDSLGALAGAEQLRAVCVNSARVATAGARLEESGVKTVALIAFPLGAMDADAKRYEAELAFDLGAQEVEVVLGLGQIKDGDARQLLRELRDIVSAAAGSPVGVIIEAAKLAPDELRLVGEVVQEAGVARVCTSTDFWPDAEVTADTLRALQGAVGQKTHLKAVGGIRDWHLARALFEAGAAIVGGTNVTALLSPRPNAG